jgi:hypothetical protein
MTPAKCPGCGTKLKPDMEACPNCPMSFTGQEDGENNPLKAQSPLRDAALPLAFFALLALGVWKLGTGLLKLGQDGSQLEHGSFSTGGGKASTTTVAKLIEDSARPLTGDDGPSGPAPGTVITHKGAGSVAVMPRDGDAEEGSGTISVVRENARSSAAARAPREWRLRGRVYDLVTLKPVAGALLTLLDGESNARAETTTSADGRYRTVLPPLREHGYVVSIKKAGYAQSYAGPESAGVYELDAGSRKELARQLARSVEAPASLEPGSEAPLITDFFLAPLDVR